MTGYQIYPCGDNAVTIELGDTINLETHQRVMALYQHIANNAPEAVKDIIPAYTSVTVLYNMGQVKKQEPHSIYQHMCRILENLLENCVWDRVVTTSHMKIPVCYDVGIAPDIERMAEEKRLSVEEIIHIHSSPVYHVYMLGFLPGFAYMGTVDDRIATARLARPRLMVEAGSVGIAGRQTGIYSLNSPGGWNIIGQTPVQMFDASKKNTCYVNAGDTVSFVPISLEEFVHLKNLA
ncbi:5-oxoprolinase subunit PxpB [Foetidibacter luteolus]|uniref:5-oxoprolinase subunit PxpB n=1 Tax=Foetidibacter luteolus TaxID=2608880 RepID=UPI00129B3D8E|nr:5-oxoprolinase subunit PxpB [Foetidibacter luteolus]